MTEPEYENCPGGAHEKPGGQVCCDVCWERVPKVLELWGESRPWRRLLQQRRAQRDWNTVETIIAAIVAWLVANPS